MVVDDVVKFVGELVSFGQKDYQENREFYREIDRGLDLAAELSIGLDEAIEKLKDPYFRMNQLGWRVIR